MFRLRALSNAVVRVARASTAAAVMLVASLAPSASAQPTSSAAPGQNLLTAAQARADLEQLHAALVEAHGAPYRFVAKPELETRYRTYVAGITGPITQFRLLGYVSRMLADLGDGHARAGLDSASARRFATTPLLPLRVRLEGSEHLMVIGNDTPDDTLLAPGAEVVRINGKPVSDVLRALFPLVPHDGLIASGRDARMSRAFPTLYHQFVDQSSTFEIAARRADGSSVVVRVAGITDAVRASTKNPINARYDANVARLDGARLDGVAENISIRFPGDGTVGVLRIHGFGGDRFIAELDSVFTVAHTRGVRGMVLDLRGNGGGVDMDGANLAGRFTDTPFRYFDHIHVSTLRPSFTRFVPHTYADLDSGTTPDPAGGWFVKPNLHPGVSEQPPDANPFLGPLVVLMDGGTFSTAADVTARIRGFGRATFVGEESGGAYEGNTSGLNGLLYLANSGVRVALQMYGYVNAAPAPRERGRGTLPDIALPLRVQDILRGEDPAMAKALELAKVGTQPR